MLTFSVEIKYNKVEKDKPTFNYFMKITKQEKINKKTCDHTFEYIYEKINFGFMFFSVRKV